MSSISNNSQFFSMMKDLYNQAMKDQSVNKNITADQQGTSADSFEPLLAYLSSGSMTGSNASSLMTKIQELDDISVQKGSWSGQHGTDSTNSAWANDMDSLVQMTSSMSEATDFAAAVSSGEKASGYVSSSSGSTESGQSTGSSTDSSGSGVSGTSGTSTPSVSAASGGSTSTASIPSSATTPPAGQTTTDLKTALALNPNAHQSVDAASGITALTTKDGTFLYGADGEGIASTSSTSGGWVDIRKSNADGQEKYLALDANGNLTAKNNKPAGDSLMQLIGTGSDHYVKRPEQDQNSSPMEEFMAANPGFAAHNDVNNHITSISTPSGVTLFDDHGQNIGNVAPGQTGVIKVNNSGPMASAKGLGYVTVAANGALANTDTPPANQAVTATLDSDGKGGWKSTQTGAGTLPQPASGTKVPDSISADSDLAKEHKADITDANAADVFQDPTTKDYFYKKPDGTWNVYDKDGKKVFFGALQPGQTAKLKVGSPGVYLTAPKDGTQPLLSSGLPQSADKNNVLNGTGIQTKDSSGKYTGYNATTGGDTQVPPGNMHYDPISDISYGKDKNGNFWAFDATGKRILFVKAGKKASVAITNPDNKTNTAPRWNIDNSGTTKTPDMAGTSLQWSNSTNAPDTSSDWVTRQWTGDGTGGYSDALDVK